MIRPHVFAALAAILGVACSAHRLVAPLPPAPVPPGPVDDSQATPPEVAPVVDATEPIRTTMLANGMRIVVVERHSYPIVAARLLIDRGSFDLEDAGGLEVDETMRFFERVGDAAAFDRLVDVAAGTGVTWATGWDRDSSWIDVRARSASFEDMVDILGELAMAPTLGSPEHDRVAALLQRRSNWKLLSSADRMRSELFGERPYGWKGTDLPISTRDAQATRDRLFQPSHATLVVVGDVTADTIDAAMTRGFAEWSSRIPPVPRKSVAPPWQSGPRVAVVSRRSLTQCHSYVFARGPEGASDDIDALELAALIVGGNKGSTLFRRLRQGTGAAYSVEALTFEMRTASFLSIGASFDSDKAVTGVRDVLRAIDDLRMGRETDEDIAIGRETLLARWRLGMSTAAGTAATYARWIARGRDPVLLAEVPARIARLRREDIERVARSWLSAERLHVLFVGDERWLDVSPLRMGGAKALSP